jgi:hypothetical protein
VVGSPADEHTIVDMLTWQTSGGFSLDAPPNERGADMRILAFITAAEPDPGHHAGVAPHGCLTPSRMAHSPPNSCLEG